MDGDGPDVPVLVMLDAINHEAETEGAGVRTLNPWINTVPEDDETTRP